MNDRRRSTSDLWSSDRPEFSERLARLAGGTTFREPAGARGTKQDQLPDEHAVAAALAFARRGPDDIGPDVAYCWVLQSDAYRERVVRKLSVALRCHESRGAAGLRLAAAEAAWSAMIWDRSTPRPASGGREYDTLLLAAVGTLHRSAWDALAEAERRYSRGGEEEQALAT